MAAGKSKEEQQVVLTSHVQIASRHSKGATVLIVDDYSGDGCLSRLCLVRDLVTDGSGSEHQIVESGKEEQGISNERLPCVCARFSSALNAPPVNFNSWSTPEAPNGP
jgi:hypothetical protein